MGLRRNDGWEIDSRSEEVKTCLHCKEFLPLSDFRKRASSKDGRHWLCRPCLRTQEAEHREANRERYQERRRAWREANPEREAEHKRKTIELNPHSNRISVANRRAKALGIPGRITVDDWLDVLAKYGEQCLRCGATSRVEIDHVVPLTKGGTHAKENLQPLCQACNKSKRQNVEDYR